MRPMVSLRGDSVVVAVVVTSRARRERNAVRGEGVGRKVRNREARGGDYEQTRRNRDADQTNTISHCPRYEGGMRNRAAILIAR